MKSRPKLFVVAFNFIDNFGKCWIHTISLKLDYYTTCQNATERALNNEFTDQTLQWTLCVSIVSLGGLLGGLLFGPISDHFGRKRAMCSISILSILSSLLTASSWLSSSVIILQIGRFFIGLSCAAGVTVYTVYLGEIAPAEKLGFFGSAFTMGLSVSTIIMSVLGTEWVFSTYKLWPWMILVSTVFNGLQLICLIFAVESPVYLLKQNKVQEAQKAHHLLHGQNSKLIIFSGTKNTNFLSGL